MLFNSIEFIFYFLPLTLAVHYWLAARLGGGAALTWLVLASLFFYGWWNPSYLALIVASIIVNYQVGLWLGRQTKESSRKALLLAGIGIDLGVLAYFKYAGFLVDNLNLISGDRFSVGTIVLPLAISFFTFQQIAYLVDCFRARVRDHDFIHYTLFVTFFPQLIAGPIVHHRDLIPQFMRKDAFVARVDNLAVGLTIFGIGLFKKVVLADGMAVYATPAFVAADDGLAITLVASWSAALAYSLQLYFDFSGYSDMAIGLARLFGIRLPVNFFSPYKATSIIDFWRRWHITLSTFLRDYLYVPLGGNRLGRFRRYVNLMLTMLIGGLWHGAGWNFVIWGGLHGCYLVINHLWRGCPRPAGVHRVIGSLTGWLLTFTAVVFAWVPFRAESWDGAFRIWSGMVGLNGIALPTELVGRLGGGEALLLSWGVSFSGLYSQLDYPVADVTVLLQLSGTLAVALLSVNTIQYLAGHQPVLGCSLAGEPSGWSRWLQWSPSLLHAAWIALLIFLTAKQSLVGEVSEFIYFNF